MEVGSDCTDEGETSNDVIITGDDDLSDGNRVAGGLSDDDNDTIIADECVTVVEWTGKVEEGSGCSNEDDINDNDIVINDDIGNNVVDDLFKGDDDTIADDDGKWVALGIIVELGLLLIVPLVVIFAVAKVLIAEVTVLPCVLVIIGILPDKYMKLSCKNIIHIVRVGVTAVM